MIITNIEISAWVYYLYILQLIASLINDEEDYKRDYYYQ